MDSILASVKKLLGVPEGCDDFNQDIIIYINSVFMFLSQMGVGPKTPFSISDESASWSDFSSDIDTMKAIKSYVPLKVKIMFDPPTSSSAYNALTYIISEHEWRLNALCDNSYIKEE